MESNTEEKKEVITLEVETTAKGLKYVKLLSQDVELVEEGMDKEYQHYWKFRLKQK